MLTLVHTQSPSQTEPKLPKKPLAERDFLAYKLLSFDGQSAESYRRVSFAQAASGLVAFGATGSGKTAGFMLPALKALALNDCPGLVLDVKGDYALHLTKICPERTTIIGPSKHARPVNLIAGISLEVFATLMEGMRLNNGTGADSYWGSAAVEDANLVFVAVRHYESRAPSLSDIAEALSQPVVFGQKLKHWMDADGEVPDDVRRMHQRRVADKFSLVNFTDAQGSAHDTVREQYTWHVNHLLPSLLPFADNEAIRETLCAVDVPNWADMIYAENKVIAFDMPSALFGSVAFTASKIVRLLVMSAILSDTRKFAPGSGFGTEKFSFILADEYQEYISTGGQRGLINDNTFFDRSRSFHHINVVATQGVSSLIAQVGTPGTNAVLQNLRTKLFLPTDDAETLQRAETVASKSYVTMPGFLSNPSRPFSGFLYSPLSDSTFLGSGPVVTGEAGAVCPHMAIDKSLEGHVRVFERYEIPSGMALAEVPKLIDSTAGWVLHVLTTERSRSLADFAQAMSDARQMHGQDLDDWADAIAKPVVSLVSPQAKPGEWLRAMEKIEADADASGVNVLLAVIRGGGASESAEFLAFKDPSVVKWVKRVRVEGRVLPMFGIAHAQDDFPVHREAFLTGATPQGLGYRLGFVLSKTLRSQAPAPYSSAGPDTRTQAYESMATALNALYFSPSASPEKAEPPKPAPENQIDLFVDPSVEKKKLAGAAADLLTDPASERHQANKEWRRIGAGLLKIEEMLGTSPIKASMAVAEFMKGATIHYPSMPLPPRNAAQVEDLINEFIDKLPAPIGRNKQVLESDLMRGPLTIPEPDVETEPQAVEEDFDAEAFVKTIDDEPPETRSFDDSPLSLPEVASQLSNPYLLGHVTGSLADAVSRLRVVKMVVKTFGDSLWDSPTKRMLTKTLELVRHLTPLSAPPASEELTEESIDDAIARLESAESMIQRHGQVWGEAEMTAVQLTAMAIRVQLDPRAGLEPKPNAGDTAYAMACLEISALKAKLDQSPNEGPTEKSVLAPVLSNVAMFCANLLHQRQMSVVLSDTRYQAPADWSFLPKSTARAMASRFPMLKDICMARTRDVLEIDAMGPDAIKTVIAWLDQQTLLHCLIDEEGLAKLDLFLVDDGPKKDEHAWELPHLLTGSYNVAKLFLKKVDERERSILISENGGDSLAANFHSVVGCSE